MKLKGVQNYGPLLKAWNIRLKKRKILEEQDREELQKMTQDQKINKFYATPDPIKTYYNTMNE